MTVPTVLTAFESWLNGEVGKIDNAVVALASLTAKVAAIGPVVSGPPGPPGPAGPAGLDGTGTGGGQTLIPGAVFTYSGGTLTGTFADGSSWSVTGTLKAAPPKLPVGVLPNSLPVVNVSMGSADYPDLAVALLAVADGGLINVAAGTYTRDIHIDSTVFTRGLTIVGAGKYQTIVDGRGGLQAGFRLAWGKGIIHTTAANVTVRGLSFVNGGSASSASDGESGFYVDAACVAGPVLVDDCTFDNCEDGIAAGHSGVTLTINNCEFGFHTSNGLNDGLSHDVYVGCDTVIHTNNRHYGPVNHCFKARCPHVSLANNFFRRIGGRWIDLPDGTLTVATVDNCVFTDLPGASTNGTGYNDESSNIGAAGMLLTNPIFNISRYSTILRSDVGPTTLVNPTITCYLIPGAPAPSWAPQYNIVGLDVNLPAPTSPIAAPASIS